MIHPQKSKTEDFEYKLTMALYESDKDLRRRRRRRYDSPESQRDYDIQRIRTFGLEPWQQQLLKLYREYKDVPIFPSYEATSEIAEALSVDRALQFVRHIVEGLMSDDLEELQEFTRFYRNLHVGDVSEHEALERLQRSLAYQRLGSSGKLVVLQYGFISILSESEEQKIARLSTLFRDYAAIDGKSLGDLLKILVDYFIPGARQLFYKS